jgi:phosphatidylserine/phosphatidylglycerophosphate/cardiolipin synthase-like enzyme
MQLIKPSQISGEIMTLIEEADKKIVLISPYFRVSKWYKLLNRLEAIKQRNLEIEIYIRQGEFESIEEVLEAGFQPIEIPNLHTKLYLSEKSAIVSSMNLLLSSDTNSLDIALKTENQKEYDDLHGYYARYIRNAVVKPSSLNSNGFYNWREDLDSRLFQTLRREAFINELEGKLQIQSSNKYEAFIANGKTNDLRIFGILSGKEFDFANSNRQVFQASQMQLELIRGKQGYYDTIWGTVPGFKSRYINELKKDEEKVIVDSIVAFINGVEQLKRMVN